MKNFHKSIISLFLIIIFNACNSEIELTNNGNSSYKIVIPNNPTEIEKHSAQEFQNYVEKISGTKIEIIDDSKPETKFEISIGQTNRIKSLQIDYKDLEDDGFVIKTNEDKLFILGGKVKGTLYGVYTFLDDYLNVKMFAPDVIEIPQNDRIVLSEINDKEIPIIKYRELHLPSARSSQKFCDWHKLHHPSVRAKEYGSFVHTFQHLIPSEKYFKKHPEYFSEINGIRIHDQQLCLSNPDLYNELLKNLKQQMDKKPKAVVWDVSQNDNFGNCTCPSCSKADSIYQSPSGLMIEFVNKIAREFPEKTISTLAYQYTRKAPVNIKPEPNVMVVLCTIECDRSKPISENHNDLFNRDIKEWSALTNNIKIWDYVVQFSCYTDPFPNFHVLKPNIKLFVDHGVKSLFEQGSGDSWSDFHELKAYVLAKLMWNPNANVDMIIDEFFNGYYQNAAPFMKEYFTLRQSAVENSNDGLIIYGYPRTGVNSYLTSDLLNKYTNIFDKAQNSVSDKPEILERVKFARIPLEYAILEISKLNLDDEYKIFTLANNTVSVDSKIKDRLNFFVSNANKVGIKRIHERGLSPDEYNKQMQKYFSEGMILHKGYKKNIEVLSEFHPNYKGKGGETLVDGVTGEANYFFNWLGFEASDLEAIVDLGEVTNIHSIKTNFLQEVKSWIWLPNSVDYYISDDGENFTKIGTVKKRTDEKTTGIFTEAFPLNFNETKTRFVKIKTNSLITCPKWHIGHNHGNGKAFIFVDEIIIN